MTRPCKDCGHQISPSANACPNCGGPTTQDNQAVTIVFGIIGGIILAIVALGFLLR